MALFTDKKLRNQVMYQIFVRNFSKEGTFEKVREALPSIRRLGVDIIWLMPIHPVGKKKRKGSLGSPYAISDYRAVNPEFGTMEDFERLVDAIHALGMKCIIDVVYNHTSPDSVLSLEHPEWFYHKENGDFGNRVGDWSDIIDLDYSNMELWDYQIETLRQWAKLVDGFRCDVAPLIPLAFWLKAREEVERVRKGAIWLSESVEPAFITHMRGRGLTALSDSEIYQAFDICYDYDVYQEFREYLEGRGSLQSYAEAVNRQEYIYPENYVKLRFLENHDQPRAAFLIPGLRELKNWTAFLYFQKGLTLIYAGQEKGVSHLPSLFDKDTVDFGEKNFAAQPAVVSIPHEDGVTAVADCPGIDFCALMTRLSQIRKDSVFTDSVYRLKAVGERYLTATHESRGRRAIGVFSVRGESGCVPVDFEDGVYQNLIDGSKVEVFRGAVLCSGDPIILIEAS